MTPCKQTNNRVSKAVSPRSKVLLVQKIVETKMKNQAKAKAAVVSEQSSGPWDDTAFAQVREWDQAWADACGKMATNPWTNGILPRKTIELICIAVNAACTNLKSGWDTAAHPRRAGCGRSLARRFSPCLRWRPCLAFIAAALALPFCTTSQKASG